MTVTPEDIPECTGIRMVCLCPGLTFSGICQFRLRMNERNPFCSTDSVPCGAWPVLSIDTTPPNQSRSSYSDRYHDPTFSSYGTHKSQYQNRINWVGFLSCLWWFYCLIMDFFFFARPSCLNCRTKKPGNIPSEVRVSTDHILRR